MTPRSWQIVRSVVSACFLAVAIYVTVADYDRTVPLWKVLIYDAGGWLHEMFYIFVGWTGAIWWLVYMQRKLEGVCPLCGGK